MSIRRTRWRGAACAASALAALAALGTGATDAWAKKSEPTTQCSGADITGQGASVMKIAEQNVFTPNFNSPSDTNAAACSGTQGTDGKPTVVYTSSSSGAGLASWGVGGGTASFGLGNAFVVTEEPPNEKEKEEIENNESTRGSAPKSLLTIPVLQESIAVLVHLPTGCEATSTEFPGRLVLGNETLQEIFLGTIKNWSEIKDGGDAVTGSSCNNTTPIKVIARKDSAGSSHILKKYLNLINGNAFEVEGGKTETWNEISEGTGNTVWPTAAAVSRPSKTGDPAEVSDVAETASSIGYASLANARANTAFVPAPSGTGGKDEPTFWVPIQNDGTSVPPKKQTFIDPSTDAETATSAEANCAKEKYTNGAGSKFPPSSTDESWSPVTTATKEKAYPLCGIAYELSLTKFEAYPGTSSAEEITDANFLSFVLETKAGGGQTLINEKDYEALPKKLDKEAINGVKLIGF